MAAHKMMLGIVVLDWTAATSKLSGRFSQHHVVALYLFSRRFGSDRIRGMVGLIAGMALVTLLVHKFTEKGDSFTSICAL